MHYIVVKWLHYFSEEPVLLFSELDDQGWEIRKVEVFRDGVAYFADARRHSGSTALGLLPVPDLAEIATDSQFLPREITPEEFERVWEDALHRRTVSVVD